MENFNYQQFFNFLTKCFLSINIRSLQLQNTNDAYYDTIESLEAIFELFNDEGRWTITRWSKHGLINDASLISSNIAGHSSNGLKDNQQSSSKVLSKEVTTNVAQI